MIETDPQSDSEIRDLREAKGLKQYELADLADINKGRFSAIEALYYMPTKPEKRRIEKALGQKLHTYDLVKLREAK